MNKLPLFSVALACALAIPALAQDSAATTPRAAFAPTVTDDAAHAKAVQQFWTPERLASAKPMPLPKAEPGSSVPGPAMKSGPVGVMPGGLPTVLPADSDVSTERFPLNRGDDEGGVQSEGFNYEMPFSNYRPGGRNAFPHTAIGKLFFFIPAGASEPSGEYVCSASIAINSHLLITARHCVFDYVNQIFYQNWIFYPAWQNGPYPAEHNGWTPYRVATWVGSGTTGITTGWDIAMMTMHDSTGSGCNGSSGGRTIGSYSGWLGATYNGDYTQRVWAVSGYPQAAPFEGNWLYQDNTATGVVNPFGSSGIVQAGNPQTGGTSGGPWIIGLDINNAPDPAPTNNVLPTYVNLVNGVNSYIYDAQPLALNGTMFFTNNFLNLYNFVNGLSCP